MVYPSGCVMENVHETHQRYGKCCTRIIVLKTKIYMSLFQIKIIKGCSMNRLILRKRVAWLGLSKYNPIFELP